MPCFRFATRSWDVQGTIYFDEAKDVRVGGC